MPSLARLLRLMLFVSLLAALSICTGFYFVQKKELHRAAEEELTAIAQLKTRQISEWRRERLADARVLLANAFVTAGLTGILRGFEETMSDEMLYYFHRLQENYEYDDILLADPEGTIRLSMEGASGTLPSAIKAALSSSLQDRQPKLSELHQDEQSPHPHISIIAPIMSSSGDIPESVGAIILVCNAADFLYPIIQSWPTPSDSAETLLIMPDGNDVLFLNELRHRKDTALQFRLPVTRTDLTAVKAVHGAEGFVLGIDYRGVEVIAVLRHIPDSSWYMVAKMDRDEAFSIWHSFSLIILGSLFGLMLLTGAVFLLFWQRDEKEKFQALFQAEAALRTNEKRFLTTLQSIGDGVITTDAGGRVDMLNPVAEELTGWQSADARGRELQEVFHIINEYTREEAENPVAQVLREGIVVGLANHTVLVARDGTERLIADSGAPIRNEEGQIIGVVMVFHDTTEEKKAEKKLRKSQRMLNATGGMARIGGWEHDLVTGKTHWTSTLYELIEISPDAQPPGVSEHLSCYPPADREKLDKAYRKGMREGAPFDLELQVYTQTEKLLWCRVYGEPVFKNGACVKMRGTFQDITERKKIELAVLESRRQMQTLLGNLPGMAYRCRNDPSWPMEFVSRGVQELTGYTEIEMIAGGSFSYRDIIHPDDIERVWDTVQEALRREQPFEIEYRIRTKEGRERNVWERGQAVASDVAPGAILEGFITDITARIEAERAHDEAKKWLDLALASSQVGLWDWNPENNALYLSAELKAHIGYRDEDFANDFELFRRHVHPRDRNKLMRTMEKYLAGSLPKYAVEFRFRHRDGNYRWIYSQGEAVRDEQGIPRRILGSHIDITELKAAEAALIREKEKAEMYLNIAPFIVVGLDPEADIFLLNDQGAVILECRKEEVLGKNWLTTFVPEPERETVMQVFNRIMQGELEPVEFFENAVVTISGVEKRILWQNTILRDASGNITGTLSSGVDITDRKRQEKERQQLQAQLNQAQRMESVGRLAGGVAHDFNNMLQLILGHTDMALEEVEQGSSLREDLEEVYSAAERAAALTRQLLAFARKQQVTPEILDLNNTVASMLKMLQRLIGEDIDLAWKPRSDLWPVLIDPSQIDQILANLCVNARDAINGPGKLTIETANVVFDDQYCSEHHGFLPGEFIMLAVSDDGCGMDESTLANIFDPFFTTKPMGKGTGLGLATVYGIIRQNNGFINVYSEPGHGTTFKIYFPRELSHRRKKEDVPKTELPRAAGETILLVEDEPAVLELGRSMLERLGYAVLTANSPNEAIEIAENRCEKINMLITDVIMPSMHGKDLAGHLQKLCPRIKIMFMSGYTADVIAHRGVLDADVRYIQKPFSINDLAFKVHETLTGDDEP